MECVCFLFFSMFLKILSFVCLFYRERKGMDLGEWEGGRISGMTWGR